MYVRNMARRFHRSKRPMLLVKLDISKAFDSVKWDYLFSLLNTLGFPRRWVDWIAALLSTASSQVLLNGIPGEPFVHGTTSLGGLGKLANSIPAEDVGWDGLGVLDFQKFARALRLRWLWMEQADPDKPWRGLATPCNNSDHLLFAACTDIHFFLAWTLSI